MTELRYAIIASHGGDYVIASPNGHCACCGDDYLDQLRRTESLTTVDRIFASVLEGEKENAQHVGRRTPEELFTRDTLNLLSTAVVMLGTPPKKEVNFHSVPQIIQDALDW